MSYNGSGVFNINTTGQPVVSGTVISSTAFNALTADLATGLSTALTKDGQSTPTANIKLGGYKLVNVGTGTAATDAANVGQVQGGAATYVTASGTDTITGSLTPALTAYSTGQVFTFKAAGTNTTTVTLNIDGLGAKDITKNGTTALIAGDISSGSMVTVAYDGTQFQLLGVVPSGTANRVSFFSSTARPTTSANLTFDGTTVTTPTIDATTSLITRGALGVGATPSYGTAGQVLTSAGTGAAPTWATASSGAMVLIGTKTASASANIEWTGLATYDKYLLVYENVIPATNSIQMKINVGTGAGPTYITSAYDYWAATWDYVNSSGPTPTVQNSAAYIGPLSSAGINNTLSGASGQILFTNFINSVGTRMSVLVYEVNQIDNSSAYYGTTYGSGGVSNASARTAIKIAMLSGNITSGKFTLYGLLS